jgi:DNA primase
MAIDKADECLLVEGYTDVVSLHQAGIENVVASGGTSLTTEQLRLIKKYTQNLTIIYDGDSAGVKAALRGLDMALEEGLNVRLVLIPDNEDPDSYVNKVGTTAFNEFVATSKKDFIIFQLEVMLQEAGSDVSKKSAVVNQVAETLSKINKAEDFTKQQDYIRKCSSLLRIDETGLTNLVNKFKRDILVKQEKKMPFEEAQQILEGSQTTEFDEGAALINQDDIYEKNLIRVLLDYGLLKFDDHKTMADYIFEELEQFDFDNEQYVELYHIYKSWYEKGLEPSSKTLLYHDDENIRNLIVNLTVSPHELSLKWDTILEGMNIVNRDTSMEDVTMSVNYFKLRKIKKMFDQNQQDMENAGFEEQMRLIELHKHLKEIEREITKKIGTVIIK